MMNKVYNNKIKHFWSTKDTIKRDMTGRKGEILATLVSGKEFVSSIYKKLLQINKQVTVQ